MIEHPDITAALATGYPRNAPAALPLCPVCGEECETIYSRYDGEVVGCESCITTMFSTDWWDAVEEARRDAAYGNEYV